MVKYVKFNKSLALAVFGTGIMFLINVSHYFHEFINFLNKALSFFGNSWNDHVSITMLFSVRNQNQENMAA